MLTLVAFSLIAQNVLHVRWSCDDTGLAGISLVQVVLSVLRVGKQRLQLQHGRLTLQPYRAEVFKNS